MDLHERISLLEAQVRYLAEHAQVRLPAFRALAQSSVPVDVQQLVAAGDKLAAIKRYRELTGADLSAAKKIIDSL